MFSKQILLILLLIGSCIIHAKDNTPAPQPTQDQQVASPTPPAQPQNPTNTPPVPLPSSTEMTTSYESAFVRMLLTLLGLLVLVFATFWILRRMGKGKFKMGSGRTINVIEKRSLSPKSILYIVEIGNKKVLISESQVEVRALTTYEELPDRDD